MTKNIKMFWELSVDRFSRKVENQEDFYQMLKTANNGLRSFVYMPKELKPCKKDDYNIIGIQFDDCSFAFTTFENLNFYNCKFYNCKFNHDKFINCSFHDCKFKYVNMFKVRFIGTYIDPDSFRNIIPNYKDFLGAVNNANMCVTFFQNLLNNSKETGQVEFQKNADYHFKKWKGLNLIQKTFTDSPYLDRLSLKTFLIKFLPNFSQYIVTGYGYRVLNFLLTFITGFTIFLLINQHNWTSYVLKQRDVAIIPFRSDSSNISSSFYYTLDATTKLIDSQIQPTSNYGMIWLSIQGVFGFILLSALIAIMINKFVK